MTVRLSPVVEGHIFRIWREEIPWFFANIRANHPDLADRVERLEEIAHRMRLRGDRQFIWGTMIEADVPLFDAAIADLERGRIDRGDGIRILPKWSDGSYRPSV